MNHIYKVIWNTITQTWVAVSELSRAKGKTKSSKTLSAVVLAAVSAGAIVGDAEAAINYPTGSVYGTEGASDGMAIGLGSVAHGDSVSYGVSAQGNNRWGVTIGSNAKSGALNLTPPSINDGAVAVGAGSSAEHFGATAIGPKAKAGSGRATAVGTQAEALGENSVALGQGSKAEKAYGVALGKSANAKEQLGIAVGKNASAENFLSTAVGAKTQAKGESSIAIGSGDLAGGTDLDAPEGAKATGNASMAVGASAKATADNATALGKKATASGRDSIAAGATANASGTDSIATGHNANATGANAVATGANASAAGNAVATGANASAAGNAAAYGDNSQATGGWSSAFGNESKATATDASAFGNSANVSTQNGTAIGSHSTVTAIDGTALGNQAEVTSAGGVALGQGSKTTNKDGTARQGLNKDSYQIVRKSNDKKSEDYKKFEDGGFSYSDKDTPDKVYAPVKLVDAPGALEAIKDTIRGSTGPVSIGNQGTTRQLINVAPGSADSDAVNVAQLKAVAGAIKHYDVVSPNGDITITHPDPHDPNKTVWNLNLNPERVKEITKWKLRDVDKDGNPKAGKTEAVVKGDETVTFQDTDTIEVERVGTDGKTLKFNTKKNIKYFSVNSSGGTNEDNKGATGDNAIAIGKDAASSANNAVVIGKSATALKNNERYDLNVGTATSNADSAVVIGNSATSKQARTVAIGNEAQTLHTSAIAIGDKAYSNGARGIAIGRNAQSKGNNSIALGSGDQNDGKKTTADKDYAVAIGSDAVANIANGIALGSESKTTAASGQTGFDASQDTDGARVNKYDNLTNNAQHVRTSTLAGLSIGDTGKTRQINHLAAGTADDDAVNVAQLKSVNLAFKGNSGSGDVRLHDQRLSVVGATGSFITTKANDNKLEINTTKSNELQFTAGAANNITTPTGLTTDKAVANAINNSGWTLQAGDKTVGLINPGDKVNIASGKGITVTSTPEANNISKITINATVAGIKAGHNVTVDTDKNGISTISAIDTITTVKGKDGSAAKVTTATGSNNTNKIYEVDINVDDTTISKAGGTLHAVTGAIEEVTTTTTGDNAKKKGQVQAKSGDGDKVTTVSNVAEMINKAKWFAKAENNEDEVTNKTDDSNSDGQAMSAGDKLTLKAGKNLSVNRTDGVFTFALNKAVDLTKDGSLTIGETKVDNGGITITPTNPGEGKTNVTLTANGLDNGGNKIVNVAEGTKDTDAVNVKQLKSTELHIAPTKANGKASDVTYTYDDKTKSVTLKYKDGNGNDIENTEAKIDLSGLASKIKDYSFKTNATGSNLVGTGTDTKVESGKSVDFAASDNLTLKQDVKDGNVTYTYGLKNQVVVGEKGTPGKDGIDGSIGVNGKDGSAVAINGEDGSIGLNGKDGKNGLTIKGQDGKVGVDGKDGETRLVYVEKADPTKPGSSDKTHELATLDDGMKYGGDIGEVANVKLNKQVDIKGGVTDKTKLSDNNIGVISTPNATTGGTELTVKLAKELKGLTSAEFKGGDDNAVTNITNSGITIKPANSNDDSKTVSLTNTGLNNGGNKITHVAEGKDDTDAVNVKQLKDFKSEVAEGGLTFAGNSGTAHKAKLNTTVNIKGGEGNTDATQFDNGKNVMTTVNGDTVTVSIKKTPEVEGINITDTTGNVKVKLTQTERGLQVSGADGKETNITNVKAGEKDTDAVNVKQLKAAKTEVEAGDHIDVTSRVGANGQTIYKVSAKGINDTSAAVKAGSNHVEVTKAANTHKDGSTTVTDYTVDLSEETKNTIRDTHDKVTNKGLTFNADKGTTGVKKLGSSVAVNGDGKNITTTADENGVKVSMKDDIKVNSVTAKEVKVGDVNINENGINAGGKRITNVAPGKDGTDAVNVNQLKYVAGNISNQINNVDKGLRAGIAGALASGGLYHVTTAGKSMVSVGAGTYRGQNALAVGYSRLSDNGKVGVKFTVNSNSQGHSGASASVGYQW